MELQHNKHSCVKVLQSVYRSGHDCPNIMGFSDVHHEPQNDTEMLELSQVRY